MKSKIIVIEGLDGSGKATQTALLAKKLEQLNRAYKKLEFPDYESPSSSLVKMYLNGEFGEDPNSVNAYAAAAFYAVDRVASYLKSWKKDYENGMLFFVRQICDIKYNLPYVESTDDERDEFIRWHSDFEYNKLGIPKPDLVLYLDVEPEVSQKLMEKRYNGDLSKKDLHERNVNYLLSCRRSALYAAEKCGWKVINCCENGEIKSIEKIAREIEEAAKNILC